LSSTKPGHRVKAEVEAPAGDARAAASAVVAAGAEAAVVVGEGAVAAAGIAVIAVAAEVEIAAGNSTKRNLDQIDNRGAIVAPRIYFEFSCRT
jgi:hypothetical protein